MRNKNLIQAIGWFEGQPVSVIQVVSSYKGVVYAVVVLPDTTSKQVLLSSIDRLVWNVKVAV